MLYTEFANKIKRLCLIQDDATKIWYIDPDWKNVLFHNDFRDFSSLEDCPIKDWNDVEDILKLEVKMRNIVDGRNYAIINWLYDKIFSKDINISFDKEIKDMLSYISDYEEGNEN